MNTETFDVGADAVEPWMQALERQEAVKALTIEQLRVHLALQGWYPVESRHAALQRGDERVQIVDTAKRGVVTRITNQYPAGKHPEVTWTSVSKTYLRMMAHRIAGMS